MWPPNPRSLLSQNGEVGAMGHFQQSQPAPVAPQQSLPITIDGSSITTTSHQPSAPLATGGPSSTASSQSISTKPARKQYGLVQPEPVAPKQTLPTMTDSSSSSGISHQPSAPSTTGSPSCTASSQYISMEAAGKQNGLAQPTPMAPQQTLLMMTDSSDSSSTSHQPSVSLAIGDPSGTVSLQSTSMKLARKQYGLVRENGVTRIIPSPTSICLAEVQSKEPNSSIPGPSSTILERAMRILKNKSIKIPWSSQKRAAHQRLRKIMLPLEEEDPGIGDGDFLHLRSGVIPIRPTTQRTTTLSHCDNRGEGIDGDNASRGGDVLPETNSPHHSQNMMPHPSENGGGSNGDDAFLLTARDIPTHLSHTTMPHPSSNEGGGSNGDGTILLSTGDVPKGLTTRRLSQNLVPHPSRNEGGANINGDDAFLLSIGDVSTGSTTRVFQTTMLLHSDNEGGSSNGEDTFLLSAGDVSMGPNIPHLSQTMMPHLSNSEGGGGQGDNASLYDGRDTPTEPTIPQPMQTMTLQHSDQECTNSIGSDMFYCGSTHFL
ncbi:uncharacterized protein LOC131241400 [Magnolia sinica]|uniref:uncharacterized protein LOC131241400 n=1 Tax=Magnolia sinica TaxID=86752 RepID=UPI002659B353|nr:uncharacterized protein LOC131241400 [Magnolia sinica]